MSQKEEKKETVKMVAFNKELVQQVYHLLANAAAPPPGINMEQYANIMQQFGSGGKIVDVEVEG